MLKPSSCITVAEAKQLQNNWLATRALDIERAQGSVDPREFLFSVDELQNFLDYIKKESKTDEPLGVRVYLAAYDNDGSDKATIFLTPTIGITAGAENNYNLQPMNQGITGFPPKNY